MKNLLILATMLLTFGFANAQCKIYSTDKYGDYATKVGKTEGGGSMCGAAAFLLLF